MRRALLIFHPGLIRYAKCFQEFWSLVGQEKERDRAFAIFIYFSPRFCVKPWRARSSAKSILNSTIALNLVDSNSIPRRFPSSFSAQSSSTSIFPYRVHNKEEKKKKHVLLIIAHPDDESMFFSPTLLSLSSLGCYHLRILCLSNGNAEGLGAIRKQEMLAACSYLKVSMENVDVVDDPALQDGQDVIWSQDLIMQILWRTFKKHNIDVIITFDNYGVSGHANHIAVHRGVCRFMLDFAKKIDDNENFSIEAWQLVSVSIIKKYSGPIYVLWSMWNNRNTDQSHSFYSKGPNHSIAAMRLHATQWLWYRCMFVIFSHYTYMNILRKIDL